MCHECVPAGGWSRRRFLVGAAATAGTLGWRPAAVAAGTLEIAPRSAWAGSGEPAEAVADELDVRFLLVHHTVNANDYGEADVITLLRNIHAFHTGPERRWPDIAYNFIVDRFGRAWETRTGSIERTVAGDATGGSQGFDQKCAFLGDHTVAPPSEAAVATMSALLAWLADRSGIDTRPGATARFDSRGSNLHPAGTPVETATITGHRTMSQTSCPGDAGFAVVRDRLPVEVTARRTGSAPVETSAPTSSAAPVAPAPTSPPATPAPTTSISDLMPAPAPTGIGSSVTLPAGDDAFPLSLPALGAVGAGAVVLGTVIARRSRLG